MSSSFFHIQYPLMRRFKAQLSAKISAKGISHSRSFKQNLAMGLGLLLIFAWSASNFASGKRKVKISSNKSSMWVPPIHGAAHIHRGGRVPMRPRDSSVGCCRRGRVRDNRPYGGSIPDHFRWAAKQWPHRICRGCNG